MVDGNTLKCFLVEMTVFSLNLDLQESMVVSVLLTQRKKFQNHCLKRGSQHFLHEVIDPFREN